MDAASRKPGRPGRAVGQCWEIQPRGGGQESQLDPAEILQVRCSLSQGGQSFPSEMAMMTLPSQGL